MKYSEFIAGLHSYFERPPTRSEIIGELNAHGIFFDPPPPGSTDFDIPELDPPHPDDDGIEDPPIQT